MTARSIRMKLLLVATTFACALAARSAYAQSCVNDIDCTAHPECGGEVCDWVVNPLMTCKTAGGQTKGHDGWCTTDTDCKCHALGATCTTSFSCTFTRPCEADGGTCSGGGGSTGTAGSGGSGGSTGSAGSGGGGGGGGCSIAGDGVSASSLLLALGGLLALRARRRR